jgi:hypothetical protein
MFRRVSLLLLLLAITGSQYAMAQKKEKLALLIQNIYGPNGLTVDTEVVLLDGTNHAAHFNSAFLSEFTQLNTALAGQLASLPLPSSASGFTYRLDKNTGLLERTSQSFGPILAERAETIGKDKYSVGFSYQQFKFNTIEGLDLTNLSAVFTHDDYQLGGGRTDVITTANSIDASIGQFTTFLTYGATDRVDISLAIPIVRTSLSLSSNATIHRIGTGLDKKIHFFRDPGVPGEYGDHRQYFSSGTASGLGDVILRAKAGVVRRESLGMALAVDLRVPTGDEKDLLGSGAVGVKPFMALSFSYKRISPHINVGYQWNGKSVLAGDVATNHKEDMSDQFIYAAGLDVGLNKRVTLALDFLGQRVFDSPRVSQTPFLAEDGSVFQDISFRKASFNINNGSVGIKTNVAGHLLVNFNLRFKLNDAGLRDRVTPLGGIEYSF